MNWLIRVVSRRGPFRKSRAQRWAGWLEAGFATGLMIAGVVVLATVAALQWQLSSPGDWFLTWPTLLLQVLIGSALIAIGMYRILLAWWKVGHSAERRNVLQLRAMRLERMAGLLGGQDERWPNIPTDDPQFHLPGDRLEFRLLPSRSPAAGVLACAFAGLAFLATATVLGVVALRFQDAARIDWIAAGAGVLILMMACWSIYLFFRQLLKLIGVGPTRVELSAMPLVPGGTYHLLLKQPGRLRMKMLRVLLECEEEAVFAQGTDLRCERRVVYRQQLMRRRRLTLIPGSPFEANVDLSIPDRAMHTFHSPNNRIRWQITVEGEARGWPTFKRVFPVVLVPAA